MPDRKSSPSPVRRRRPVSPRAASPPTSSAACCGRSAPLDEQLEAERPRRAARARPRPGADHRRDRAAPARHAAPSARGHCSKRGLPPSAPQVEDILLIGAAQILFLDVPDHASVDLSVRLAQADRHASHYSGLVNARAATSSRATARARLAALDTVLLDTPGMADAALDRALRRGHRARHRRGPHPGAGARSHRQERSRKPGRRRSAAACSPPARCAPIASGPIPQLPGYDEGAWWVQDAAAALPARLLGDVRGQDRSPISAPRPAARPRSSRCAGAQVTAVDRSRAAARAACGRTWRGCSSTPRSSRPTPRHGRAGRSTPCWSTRPARRPARSGAIPTSPGSSRRPTWPSSWRCRPACSTAPRRCSSRAARWSIAPARSNPRRARTQIAALLARNPALRRGPIRADEVGGPRRASHRRTASCAPCPAIGPMTRSPGWAGSTASTPPGSSDEH